MYVSQWLEQDMNPYSHSQSLGAVYLKIMKWTRISQYQGANITKLIKMKEDNHHQGLTITLSRHLKSLSFDYTRYVPNLSYFNLFVMTSLEEVSLRKGHRRLNGLITQLWSNKNVDSEAGASGRYFAGWKSFIFQCMNREFNRSPP